MLLLLLLQFKVLTAGSLDGLQGPSATPVLWCGLRNLLHEPNTCRFQLSPLRHTLLAVKSNEPGLFSLGGWAWRCAVGAHVCMRACVHA